MNVVAVTGAAGGMGRHITLEAAARGAEVLWLVDRDEAGLASLRDELPAGCDVRTVVLDVTDREGIETLARDWLASDAPDLLVNAAGIRHAASVQDTTDDQWDQTIAVNQTGVFLLTRAASRAMLDHGVAGVIVNIASTAADIGFTERAAYCASKAALLGLTRASALDLAPHGIRVLAVSPGFHRSGISDDLGDDVVTATVPLGRRGDPSELATLVHDLAASTFITGTNITVDGGSTAGRPL